MCRSKDRSSCCAGSCFCSKANRAQVRSCGQAAKENSWMTSCVEANSLLNFVASGIAGLALRSSVMETTGNRRHTTQARAMQAITRRCVSFFARKCPTKNANAAIEITNQPRLSASSTSKCSRGLLPCSGAENCYVPIPYSISIAVPLAYSAEVLDGQNINAPNTPDDPVV